MDKLRALAETIWTSENDQKKIDLFIKEATSIIRSSNFQDRRYTHDLEALVTSLDDMVFELDGDGTFLNGWTADETRFFTPKENFVGNSVMNVFPPPLNQQIKQTIDKVIATGNAHELIYKSPFSEEYFVAKINYLKNSATIHPRVSVLVRDVTKYQVAEKKLAESEERYQLVVEGTSAGIWDWPDIRNDYIWFSSRFFELLGYTEGTLFNSFTDLLSWIHPEDRQRVIDVVNVNNQSFLPISVEYRIRQKNGQYKWVLGNARYKVYEDTGIVRLAGSVIDINDKKNADIALEAAYARLQSVIESTTSSIFAVDRDFNYITYNAAHIKLLKKIFNLAPTADINLRNVNNFSLKEVESALRGDHLNIVHELEYNSGEKIYLQATYSPIRLLSGEILGAAAFTTDITDKIHSQHELLKAKENAEAAVKAKTDFLSNISHEIRTPMNAIIGLTDVLLQNRYDSETLEYLQSIKFSANNLLIIINDLLDFSKIDAGKVIFENIGFDLHKQLHELEKTFKVRCTEKGIGLNLLIHPDVPAFLNGDPFRLNQILINLIANAIKFTIEGYVNIKVNLLEKTGDNVLLRFEIQDTGIGIPKEKEDSIFESFSQADIDTTRRFGGTGLGLAIAKNLVILQSGNIYLKSTQGEGTVFFVELPFTLAVQTEAHELATEGDHMSLKGLHVLIVEDNVINQMLIKKILQNWGMQFTVAGNGKEAINLLNTTDFDIVIMDLQMPEMNGYEASLFIRSKHTTVKNPEVPIIALSADAFAETRRKVLEAGMNDFVTKPFGQNDLYTKIMAACKPI